MKWSKRLFATAAAAVLVFSAAGCGGESGSGNNADVEALVAKAQETMSNVNSMKSVMKMDMGMAMDEESLEITTEATILATMEPMKMQMDISAKLGDEVVQEMQMFAAEDDDQVITYMNVGDAWYAMPVDTGELDQYNAEENMNLYLENITSMSAEGEEEINGTKATKVVGVIAGDAMEEAIESSGALNSMASLGISEEEVEAMYADLGDLPIILWIDADGYVVKYEMDMSEMMQTIMDKAMSIVAEEGDEDASVQITKMMVSMVCSDFDAVGDIEIPAEALEAEVLQ